MKIFSFPLKRVLGFVFGALFIYASVYKIMSPGAFAHQIYNYKILPSWAINPLALTLPWLQIICGLCLIFNRFQKAASLLVTLMLFVFQAAVASALVRHLNISCGCFKSGGEAATWMTWGRDFVMFLFALYMTYRIWKKKDRRANANY